MAKSNRRRKQDRVKRRSTAASRAASAQRRRALEREIEETRQRAAMLWDPATPPDVIASLIEELYEGKPVSPVTVETLTEQHGSAEVAVKAAEALYAAQAARPEGPSLTALTFAALAARRAGDGARARELLDAALARAEEPGLRLRLAGHLQAVGRVADAVEIVAAHVTDPAYAVLGAHSHRLALEEAHRRLTTQEPDAPCPCRSGGSWSACCRSRDAAAVEAFLDRSGLHALRTAVIEYLPGSPYQEPVEGYVAEWLQTAAPEDWEPVDPEPLVRMATEHAWVLVGADEDRGDADNVLTALAADPTTDPGVAAAALTWRSHIRYGLWQVAEPTPAPGLMCTDVLSGHELYVAFAPEQVEGLARWTVLLGALVPLDGAWRATDTLIHVSPREADALVEIIRAATEVVVMDVGGGRVNRKAARRLRAPAPFGAAPPHSVYAYLQGPLEPEFAELVSRVTGSLVPRLFAEVTEARATPPALTNTDGDPMTLIKARIKVGHGDRTRARLAAHPDIWADPDDESRLVWYGKQIPAERQAAMLAEARAALRAQGQSADDIVDSGEPSRWVRGTLGLHGDELTVEVNSRQRLDALLAILDEVGAEPTVIDQSSMDPAQDLPWPGGRPLGGGGLAPPEEGWARQWLDEPVPALRGRTPRQVADSEDWPLVEWLLRQFEYEADGAAADGVPRPDSAAWLREQLDLPVDRLL